MAGARTVAIVEPMSTTTPSSSPTAALVRGYLDAVRGGDHDTARAALHDDASLTFPGSSPLAGTWRGADVMLGEFLDRVRARFAPDAATFDTRNVVADGDRVVVEWTIHARTSAGDPYDNDYVAIFELRDGRIAAMREYLDTAYAERVLFSA